MYDAMPNLAAMHRPRLLIRAAHFGLSDYRRDRDLPRVTRQTTVPSPERALATLMEEEERLDISRRNEEAGYSLARHIDVLIALIAEARLIPPPVTPTTRVTAARATDTRVTAARVPVSGLEREAANA
ncbi:MULTISPECIES: DUF6477 family protein [unclassified Haematobacter]|uniref:DUF6477 family protein n=1 Tax=unclassified Haematobacter TaxID=2640585 RepID=UPI0025BCBD41|nr:MULTISPECIES: DUF6477 family protein [unclassified Haematobacter]